MCRLLLYVGLNNPILMSSLLIHPPRSIIHQSYASLLRLEGPSPSLNGDGFGVGWYSKDNKSPCIFTSVAPAWNNRNLHRLSCQIISPLFFAHIRAATPGSPTNESNCHPFQFDQFMWMHNGFLADFHLIKKKIIHYLSDDMFNLIQGTTDSEYCFIVFLQVLFNLKQIKFKPSPNRIIPSSETHIKNLDKETLQKAMEITISLLMKWIKESGSTNPSMLNFCISDGNIVVATRYANFNGNAASLFFSSGSSFQRNPNNPDSFMMAQNDRRQKCHIVTSEPLTDDDDDWVKVPRNHLIVIAQSNLLVYPINDIYE